MDRKEIKKLEKKDTSQKTDKSKLEKDIKDIEPNMQVMSLISQVGGIQPDIANIAKKISSEHISRAFDLTENSMNYTHKDGIYDRISNGSIFIISIIFLTILVFHLSGSNETLLKEIITILVVGGGGYGLGYYKSSRKLVSRN